MMFPLPAGALDLEVSDCCGRQAKREKFFPVGLGTVGVLDPVAMELS